VLVIEAQAVPRRYGAPAPSRLLDLLAYPDPVGPWCNFRLTAPGGKPRDYLESYRCEVPARSC